MLSGKITARLRAPELTFCLTPVAMFSYISCRGYEQCILASLVIFLLLVHEIPETNQRFLNTPSPLLQVLYFTNCISLCISQ